MAVTRLADPTIARLRREPFTYDAVGATAGAFPPGYASLHRVRVLPRGVRFEDAVDRLMSWQLHAGAGLRVATSGAAVGTGGLVVLGIGPRPLQVSAPCRVVYVVDERDRRGFAYGTLPGHPESGEESFVLHRRADGRTELAIDAFSRPAGVLAGLGGPVARRVQGLVTRRYLHALDR